MKTIKNVEILLKDYRPDHSLFQIENFIVGTNKHIWERYKQSLRELSARHSGIKNSTEKIKELTDEIKKISGHGFFKRLFSANQNDMEKQLSEIVESHKSKLREYDAFYEIAKELKSQIGEVSDERRQRLEMDAWIHKAKMAAAIDLLSIGGLQRSTIEFIASFPKEPRRQMLNCLKPKNRQELLSIIDN